MRREEDEIMATAIAALSNDYQEVIRLRIWGGLMLEQIADRTGCSLDAVRMLFCRAIEQLKRGQGNPR
jgi:RNA polymerase sigma factor (sigma-70 family)